MELKTRWIKRASAWVLCFCLLGGVMLGGTVLPTKAEDASAAVFSVNFSDLAAKVDASAFDANNLYFSKYNDEGINNWINSRFDIYSGREGNPTMQRMYLGQSSYAFLSDRGERSGWGGEHRWQIDKNGYLRYYTSQVGGELLRKGEQLVLKTADGAQAQLKNFRATIVFNTADHARGAVVLAFHEQTPGRFVDNGSAAAYSHNNAVIIGNADRSWDGDTADTMAIRKSGNLTSKEKIATANNYAAKTALTGNLQANTDYTLSVEVIGTNLTATVSTMDGTELGKLSLNDLVPYLGTMSVGAVNSARAFKSIEVTELDENGDAVDFGTHTTPLKKFTYNFNNLLTFNDGTGNSRYSGTYFKNGTTGQWWLKTTDGNVTSAAKAELQYLLRARFDEYLDATTGIVTKTDFEKTDGAGTNFGVNNTPDNAGFWQVLSNEFIQREVDNIQWRENLRLVSSLVPKSETTGEAYTMTNFEASFVAMFEYTGSGSIVLGARQQSPGKFTAYSNDNDGSRASKEQALVVITQDGFSVAGGSDITDAMYNSIAYTFSDYTPVNSAQFTVKVRMVGNNCYLQISYSDTDLFNNFAGGKDEATALNLGGYDREGYVAFGLGEDKMGIKNISLTKLDENGNPVDIDNVYPTLTPQTPVETELSYFGGKLKLTAVEQTDAGYRYTLEVVPDAGYQLAAGKFYAACTDGTTVAPQRVGWREGGDGNAFTVEVSADAVLHAAFFRNSGTTGNIAPIATSVNEEKTGLRFIHRAFVYEKDGKHYVWYNNSEREVADYGVLIGTASNIGTQALTVGLAEQSSYIQQVSVKDRNVYYDYSATYVDMSVCVVNLYKVENGEDVDITTRAYVKLANGMILYGDACTTSYNAAK